MRIIHVVDYFQPQLGYQETFLAKEQAKMGHEVFVITSDRYDPFLYSDNKRLLGESRIIDAGLFVEDGIKIWRLNTLFELRYAIWMKGLESKIQELQPDVVIVHRIVKFESIRVARLKKRLGTFKLIYDDHMSYRNTRSPLRVLYPLFRWTFSHLIQESADALVAIADDTKDFMVEKYGIPPERITVIPLGADDKLFRFDNDARKQVRKQLSLDAGEIVFIYTGKILPWKNLGLLIEAVRLLKSHANIKVLMIGDGSQAHIQGLKEEIQVNNMQDIIIMHDAVPNKELYKYYSAADVAVWPFGASIGQREAMACNLPLIVSDSLQITELADYDSVLLFRDNDASDLAKKMETLLATEQRKEMGLKSRRYIEERLSWKVIARQFLDLVA